MRGRTRGEGGSVASTRRARARAAVRIWCSGTTAGVTVPLYADGDACSETLARLRASGWPRADELADVLAKTLAARAAAAARGRANALTYSRDIKEALRAVTKGMPFHREPRTDVAVAGVYRRIEAMGGCAAVALRRLPDRETVVRFVTEMAAELREKDREATLVSD